MTWMQRFTACLLFASATACATDGPLDSSADETTSMESDGGAAMPAASGGSSAGTSGSAQSSGGASSTAVEPVGSGAVDSVASGADPVGSGGVDSTGVTVGTGDVSGSGGAEGTTNETGSVAGGAPASLGAPIDVAPTEQWTWVPIDGTVCADGTTAGVGVNFTTQSRDLVIFFQGNGVCYDLVSCTMFQSLLTGMGPNPLDHMWWGDPNTGHLGIFDRSNPDNPLRQSNFIVFPHCGVDGHSADKDSTYPPLPTIHQHGYANVTVALRRIVPTFLDAGRIVVAGFSAGGIGAGANYHQIAAAFEQVGRPALYLIDDGGPVLRPPYLGPLAQSSLRNGWGLANTIETWCPDCATEGYHAVHETLARLHPGLRASVVCSYNDGVATPLYGLLNADPLFIGATMEAGLRDLSSWSASFQASVAPSVQHEFFYPGSRHGALVVDSLTATPGLTEFLGAQLNDSPTWATVQQ